MNRPLLIVVVFGSLLVGVPTAYGQYIYLDMTGDGVCDWQDILIGSVTSLDVWLDTSHNQDGSVAGCAQDAGSSMTISGYEFILQVADAGSVTFGIWTDQMGFTNDLGRDDGSRYVRIARSSASPLAPGKYKLGNFAVLVAGNPDLWPVQSVGANHSYRTGFMSDCSGVDADHFIKLGPDFSDVCGAAETVGVEQTTWGKIKSKYP